MGAQWKAKHKDLASNAKGRLFGKLAKEIMVAARHGADPAANARLRVVVEQARKASMPKDTLARAIKKGAGLTGEAVHFEHLIYEGFAPPSGTNSEAVGVSCNERLGCAKAGKSLFTPVAATRPRSACAE